MAKVYGVHEIELRPGVEPQVFEQFFTSKVLPVLNAVQADGWHTMLLIGNRGERNGKYLILFDIPSVEERDRAAPDTGKGEIDEVLAKYAPLWEEFMALATMPGGDSIFTDYVVLA